MLRPRGQELGQGWVGEAGPLLLMVIILRKNIPRAWRPCANRRDVTPRYLDAIASVGLHMSVGLSVGVPFDDGTSVSNLSTLDGNSLCNKSILMSAAHWPTDISCSLVN